MVPEGTHEEQIQTHDGKIMRQILQKMRVRLFLHSKSKHTFYVHRHMIMWKRSSLSWKSQLDADRVRMFCMSLTSSERWRGQQLRLSNHSHGQGVQRRMGARGSRRCRCQGCDSSPKIEAGIPYLRQVQEADVQRVWIRNHPRGIRAEKQDGDCSLWSRGCLGLLSARTAYRQGMQSWYTVSLHATVTGPVWPIVLSW